MASCKQWLEMGLIFYFIAARAFSTYVLEHIWPVVRCLWCTSTPGPMGTVCVYTVQLHLGSRRYNEITYKRIVQHSQQS